MNLISYQESWDVIKDTINSKVTPISTDIEYYNFNNYIANQKAPEIFYIDTSDKNWNEGSFYFLYEAKKIVFNSTVTSLPALKYDYDLGTAGGVRWVFKHNSEELQKLNIHSDFLNYDLNNYKITVPIGTKQDYINKFNSIEPSYTSPGSWWHLTDEQKIGKIQEGDEYEAS